MDTSLREIDIDKTIDGHDTLIGFRLNDLLQALNLRWRSHLLKGCLETPKFDVFKNA